MSAEKTSFMMGKVLEGMPWPSDHPEENYYALRAMTLRPGDIFLASYPKAGTNWTAYILWGILHPEEDPPSGDRVQNEIRFVDYAGMPPESEPGSSGRTMCTHLPADRLPNHPGAKFVAIVRNPFDLCVSLYFAMRSLQGLKVQDGEKASSDFFEWFINGEIAYGDYFDHVKSWYDRRLDDNVFFVTYEELKKDPRTGVLNLAKFVGLDGPLEAQDGKLLDKIVQQSSIGSMKKIAVYTDPEAADPKAPVSYYVRKGLVGGFRDTLTPEQEARIRTRMEERLAGTELYQQWRHL